MGGEEWKFGNTYNVSWLATNPLFKDQAVNIVLIMPDHRKFYLTSATSTTGYATVKIPNAGIYAPDPSKNLIPGQYKIQVLLQTGFDVEYSKWISDDKTVTITN